ncbi:PREDICTED: ethylene response sensor 2 [Tarenaya hassleriana]|uniref:ethylene response sensor 2 n=1 Tax=Tarenaya hassleriana TaxID=28532 RepID=UPI00053C0862|nr:PREDICTED: ethylene response sensor 2 [Tarenaya hassleriana]XP_010522487.1 PREDICTED: ethylene response sensor 2 [Tarenaya hassleriana]XP_010522488.1 PREDICTED: ethylene response sensor 2 [Tarenaya hassleriana]
MLRTLFVVVLFFFCSVSLADNGFSSRCNCNDEKSFWHYETILLTQRAADFTIALAYLTIPLELIYFMSTSYVPFKFYIIEFIAFIVLCGLTHLFTALTSMPHPFLFMAALTISKILTGFVSIVTALSMVSLIPVFFLAKIREFLLIKKACELDREVGFLMKQKETGVHVRMLTQEIRKSLDRHTILYTTLVELSRTLGLHSCAVWMPNNIRTEMNLTHEFKPRNHAYSSRYRRCSVPIDECDVSRIKCSEEVEFLSDNSVLARVTGRGEAGPTVGIRVPMLPVSSFNGRTPEEIQMCYAILVLVLPRDEFRHWTHVELEIIECVADQVAVAISHAAILEESQLTREKLEEQNRALQAARQDALRANQARTSFEQMISDSTRGPVYSILGLLSMTRDHNLSSDQKIIVDTMAKTSNLLSILINNNNEAKKINSDRAISLQMRGFSLHSLVKEAACSAKCLCVQKGFGFSTDVDKWLVDRVVGDSRRVFQLMLHMLGLLMDQIASEGSGRNAIFRVFQESECTEERRVDGEAVWRLNYQNETVNVRFEFVIVGHCSVSEELHGRSRSSHEDHMSFRTCERLVKVMKGKIWVVRNHQGSAEGISAVLRFQLRPSLPLPIPENSRTTRSSSASCLSQNT